jgi:hypothetical protein
MHLPLSTRWLSLLGLLLAACATSAPAVREDDEAPEVVSSWEEARADPSCVVPLCDEERCALWRCRDLVEEVDAPSVVLARGPMPAVGMRPPLVGNPRRWWAPPLAAPTTADPVFEIPWHNYIFPQAQYLAEWFKSKSIDIHAFTVSLPKGFHQWLHSGGPKGGQWNEAWRQFRDENPRANAKEIWRFAFELMFQFRVNGPFVPYYCQE